ncbi:MAG: molybdopterin-dependent oxidoreductase [Sphaerobacter sp.]|nr:molybdopterin-dependent oxidoreductase [Sphaerobacter sp.]
MAERVTPVMERALSRRRLLKSAGALVISFSLAACSRGEKQTAPPAGSPAAKAPASPTPASAVVATPTPWIPTNAVRSAIDDKSLDGWLAIAPDGTVTVYCGKVELGTGVRTALAQIVAEELSVPFERVEMVMGDTAATPDQGYTAGSKTLQVAGPVLQRAAAQAYALLLDLAAERLGAPKDQLVAEDGVIRVAGNDAAKVSYGELIGGKQFQQALREDVTVKPADQHRVVGQSIPRVDLPGKITGKPSYVQDLRLPGMLHGRVIRPAAIGARLLEVDESSVKDIPTLVKVVRNGNFLGVVAEREEDAIKAAKQLKATWEQVENLPAMEALRDFILSQPIAQDKEVARQGDVEAALAGAAVRLEATYQVPYQMHGSIGPSCAVADVRDGEATVYSSTQGVYPLRGALAQLLGLPEEKVRVIHVEGAGCYGHNGFDDVAADAALLSQAVGKPVRVQWMRHDEHGWEPKGPAMVIQVSGGLDGQGNVVAWDYAVWTPTHSTRPGKQAGNLLAGQLVDPPAPPAKNSNTGGDRNANHNYAFPNNRIIAHWLASSPLRQSALRSLGAFANVNAVEGFMDELAAAAKIDPVAFRLKYLTDPRAIDVLKAAAEKAGWESRPSPNPANGSGDVVRGRGVAYAQYEGEYAYVAAVAEVEVNRQSGEIRVPRVVVAHDCGIIVNPDGLKNQIEGNVIQGVSRMLKERVTFDRARVTSLDWSSYPILTFPEVPEVEIVLIDRPDQSPLGAGEPAISPVGASIANAFFDATGVRLREIPFTPDRVKAALA